MRACISAACLLLLVAADEIDPRIYSKVFMNNKPLFEYMASAVSAKLPPAGRVLDLGAGPGEPTLTLAAMSPDSRIVCTDIQPAMNAKARGRVEAAGLGGNVEFAVTSADDLGAWRQSEFDAVILSFVLMFVPDKARSLEEVARVLKPGGFAYISVWKDLKLYDLAHEAIEEVAGKAMPRFALDPLKLSADDAVEDLATAAGLEVVGSEKIEYPFHMGAPEDAAEASLILAGSMLEGLEAGGDSGARGRFYAAIERIIRARGWDGAGEVVIPDNAPQVLVLRRKQRGEL